MTAPTCAECGRTFARSDALLRHTRRRSCDKAAQDNTPGWQPGRTTGDRKLDAAIGRFLYWPGDLPCDYDIEEIDA